MTFEQWCARRGIVQVEGPRMKALREAWGLLVEYQERIETQQNLKKWKHDIGDFLNPDEDVSVEEQYGVTKDDLRKFAKGSLEGRVEALERIVEEWA